MRFPRPMLLIGLLTACASGPDIVDTRTDRIVSVAAVADDLAAADVVALGELHETPAVHRTHLELIEAMHARRPNLVIAMEMLERDAQTALLRYLQGLMPESEFLAAAGLAPGSKARTTFERDYRPVVQFAREHGLVMLAANAPRELVARVRKDGLAAVQGDPGIAREVTVPEDDGYDEFVESMAGHPGVTEEAMRRYWVAQCVWDATMAESITDFLQRQKMPRPLVVLICGRQHSDHRRGAVRALLERMPDLDVRVLSTEEVGEGRERVYESTRGTADYVVVVPTVERPEWHPPVAPAEPAPTASSPGSAAASSPAASSPAASAPPVVAPPVATAVEQQEQRPGLGFRPEYGGGERGLLVGPVTEGGPADRGGLQEGDEILSINEMETGDIQAYVEVLSMLKIGSKARLKVLRGAEVRELTVEVGTRSR